MFLHSFYISSEPVKMYIILFLFFHRSGCNKLNGARGESAIQVYEEAMAYMKSWYLFSY